MLVCLDRRESDIKVREVNRGKDSWDSVCKSRGGRSMAFTLGRMGNHLEESDRSCVV